MCSDVGKSQWRTIANTVMNSLPSSSSSCQDLTFWLAPASFPFFTLSICVPSSRGWYWRAILCHLYFSIRSMCSSLRKTENMFVTAVVCFRFISDIAMVISWACQQFISVASVFLLKKSRFIPRSSRDSRILRRCRIQLKILGWRRVRCWGPTNFRRTLVSWVYRATWRLGFEHP